MPAIVLGFWVAASSGAWAQRGGSVRYSGGASFGRTTARPAATAASRGTSAVYRNPATGAAAVRYQAPMNMAVGAAVRTLPVGYRAMAVAGRNYYYYGGCYYAEDDTSSSSDPTYTVVQPPLGATTDTLPPGAVQVAPDVYEANGVKYRPCFEDGKIVYVVSN